MTRIAFWACLSLLGLSGVARAQTAGADHRAAAEALFSEGRALSAKGHYAEACPKFEASQQLDPGLGTKLNLAECYEKVGKTASAWTEYRDAIPLARASGSKVRLDLATSRAAALEPRLSTLTLRAPGAPATPGLEIRRDGAPVLPAELDSAIPVDPGTYTLAATAPGKKPWSTTVHVGADAARVVMDVPTLDDDPNAKANASAATPGAPPPPKPDEPAAKGGQSTQRTVAVVVGSVGVVGLGLGTAFGLMAKSSLADAKDLCSSYPVCTASDGAADKNSTANTQATVSTVAFIAGGAALATGAILWFTAGSKDNHGVALGFGPGAAFLKGSFQ